MIVIVPVHVIEWVWAPRSLHVSYRYWVPGPTAWGLGALIVTDDALSHQNTYGPVCVVPATTTSRPVGFVWIVTWYCRTNVAVIVFARSHVVAWVWSPASSHEANRYWLVGETVWGLGALRFAWAAALQ